MSIEVHYCNVKDCKGFVVFENTPFVEGMNELSNFSCTECGKEYKVIPHYIVTDSDSVLLKSASILEWEKREKERNYELETDPYEKIRKFINLRGYSYGVEDIINSYRESLNGYYVSYTAGDCIKNLGDELKEILKLKGE